MIGLRETLEAATAGPWEHWRDDGSEGFYVGERGKGYMVNMGAQYADARLIALAPELASLVLDMGEALRADYVEGDDPDVAALLARLDRIVVA